MRPGSPLRFQPLPPSETPHAAPDNTLGPAQGACTAGAEPRGGRWGNQPASIPKPPVVALFRVVVEGRDAPVQAGPQGPYLLLERRDGRCVTRRAVAQRRTRVAR